MREGKGLESWLDSLRFNLLAPLKIMGRRMTSGTSFAAFVLEFHELLWTGPFVIPTKFKKRL